MNAALIGADAGAEAAAADGLGVEEGHVADVCVVLSWCVGSVGIDAESKSFHG